MAGNYRCLTHLLEKFKMFSKMGIKFFEFFGYDAQDSEKGSVVFSMIYRFFYGQVIFSLSGVLHWSAFSRGTRNMRVKPA